MCYKLQRTRKKERTFLLNRRLSPIFTHCTRNTLIDGCGLFMNNYFYAKMAEGLGLSELFSHGWEVQKRVESGSLSSSNKV